MITRRLLALPKLTSLKVWRLVATAPLRHPTLAHLAVNTHPQLLEALAAAELPALQSLELDDIDYTVDVAELLAALERVKHAKLGLELKPTGGPSDWTGAHIAELERVWCSIARLRMTKPILGFDCTLPAVTSLELKVDRLTWALPALPALRELTLLLFSPGFGGSGLFRQLRAYRSTLRSLHLRGWDPDLSELLDEPMPNLRALALELGDPRRLDEAADAFASPAFEGVETLSLGIPRTLEHLASSPLAPRIKTLSLSFDGELSVKQYLAIRKQLKGLQRLVLRGRLEMPASELAKLYEQGHAVTLGEPEMQRWPGLAEPPGAPCFL